MATPTAPGDRDEAMIPDDLDDSITTIAAGAEVGSYIGDIVEKIIGGEDSNNDDDDGAPPSSASPQPVNSNSNNNALYASATSWESLNSHQLRAKAMELLEDDDGAPHSSPPPTTRTSAPTLPSSSYAEPPKWRFVNTAKKSLGYSSTAAGQTVKGISAEDLGAKYVTRQGADTGEAEGNGELKRIGKVAVPAFLQDGTGMSQQEVLQPRMKIANAAAVDAHHHDAPKSQTISPNIHDMQPPPQDQTTSAHNLNTNSSSLNLGHQPEPEIQSTISETEMQLKSLKQEIEQTKRLQEMQNETIQMQQKADQLHVEIREAKDKKRELKRETKQLESERKAAAAAVALAEASAAAASAAAAINTAHLPQAATTTANDNENESPNSQDEKSDNNQQKCKFRILYAMIFLLLCGVGALAAVMFTSSNENESNNNLATIEDANSLRGGDNDNDNNNKGSAVELTPVPPLPKPSVAPTQPPTPQLTDYATEVAVSILSISSPQQVDTLQCPQNSKKFILTIFMNDNPSDITWVLLDRCNVEVYYRCARCYSDSPPNYPVSFSACLPSTYNIIIDPMTGAETGVVNDNNNNNGEGREYVLQMVDLAGMASYGYEMQYDGEVVFGAEKGGWDNTKLNYFGEGGGCSEMPSSSPLPTPTPTNQPTQSPSPYPTIKIAMEFKAGCTPFVETTGSCARIADMEVQLYTPDIGEINNRMFGSSVTFVGNTGKFIAIGSGVDDSAVHIYHKAEELWEYWAAVELPDFETSSVLFGASLDSNDEGLLVVGAPLWSGDLDSGKVYVYRPNPDFTEWDMVARLSPNDGTFGPSFGASVAFGGSLIAVGSPDEFSGTGAVYVFENTGPVSQVSLFGSSSQGNGWVMAVKLSPDEVADGGQFGSSVSLYGDSPVTLAVGAPKDGVGGSAFVYKRSGFDWIPQKLTTRDIQLGDDFGSHVEISGCTVAVSSPNDNSGSTVGTGTVRIFNYDANNGYWVHAQIVEPGDGLQGEIFGQCIALEGNTLLVGSPWGRDGGERSGVIYHFERIGGLWTKISVISNENHKSGDEDDFGCPLSLSGDLFVTGARSDSTLGPSSGSAFIFDLCPG